ncbi:MAG: hypothetical protein ACYSR5_05145 [Planctomycetota bacterium]|jgi:hypothetical protein
MAENYKPIDMKGYPYKPGDKLDNGITVVLVRRGDKDDSFAGYKCKEVVGVDRRQKPIYGETVIVQTLEEVMKGAEDIGSCQGFALKMIGIVPDPQAQWVFYNVEGEKRQQRARPDEFLKIAKGKSKAVTNPMPGSTFIAPKEEGEGESGEGKMPAYEKQCQAMTQNDTQCKRLAVDGEEYCSQHLE